MSEAAAYCLVLLWYEVSNYVLRIQVKPRSQTAYSEILYVYRSFVVLRKNLKTLTHFAALKFMWNYDWYRQKCEFF